MQKSYTAFAFALLLGMSFSYGQKTSSTAPQSFEKSKPPFDPTVFYPPTDNTPPSISCIPNISVNFTTTANYLFWYNDFLLSASDNITPLGFLKFGIRVSGTGQGFPVDTSGSAISSHTFDCDQLGVHQMETWAMDWAGNTSTCISTVTIQDPNDLCTLKPGRIKVHLTSWPDCSVSGATLEVKGIDSLGVPFQFFVNSDDQLVVVPAGSTGTITPMKDDYPTNGVTPWDGTLISRHLNGSQLLGSPYHIIAADVNKDGVISIQDSIDLHSLVLGIDQNFLHNTSWRFVLDSYVFQSPTNPLTEPFPESFSFANIQDEYEINFIPIKVGDVNGTAVCNSLTDENEGARLSNIPPVSSDTGDVQAPIITCFNGLSVNIMPTGMITLWSTDFVASAMDNVTPTNQIKFGIRKAETGTGFPVDPIGNPINSITFHCAELGVQTVEVWAIDLQGNADLCTTTVLILDDNNNCTNNGLDGKVCLKEYCSGMGIGEAYFRIYADTILSNPPVAVYNSGSSSACFDVPQFEQIDSNHIMAFALDDNPTNGVGTYDLQLLSKHIRGIQPFTEPWQWIAADANQDNVVDVQDSIELINLILGFSQHLPNEASWRFVRSDYVFPSPNPLSLPFPETIRVGELVDDAHVVFLGIKIGDLTIDCQPQTPVKTPANAPNYYAAVHPNPTVAGATLRVFAEQSAMARLQIRNISGKLTFDSMVQLAAGNQSMEIPAISMSVPGMYFWNLQIEGALVSGKIIRL